MQEIDLKILLEAGAHFGHKTNKWHPSASRYIYKSIGDIHIIDLASTKEFLEKARMVVFETVAAGQEVLFVGTKRQASAIIKKEAASAGAPFISARWIGGFITNWQEVKKNIEKLNQLEIDLKDKVKMERFTKRERLVMESEKGKLESVYGGVRTQKKMPDMLFVVDIRKENTAVQEAKQKNIPIAGILDTNSDSSMVDFPIPANDDAVGSISYITQIIAEAYKEGKEKCRKTDELKAKKEKDKNTTKK